MPKMGVARSGLQLLVEVIFPMRVRGSSESVFCLYLYLMASEVQFL